MTETPFSVVSLLCTEKRSINMLRIPSEDQSKAVKGDILGVWGGSGKNAQTK